MPRVIFKVMLAYNRNKKNTTRKLYYWFSLTLRVWENSHISQMIHLEDIFKGDWN